MLSTIRSALVNGFRNSGLGGVADFCARAIPMSEDKWVSIDTGGGCAALLWEFEAHGRPFYVMLTDEGGMHRPDADDWMLGVYEGKWAADGRDNESSVFDTDSQIWSTSPTVFAQVSGACQEVLAGKVSDSVREMVAARLASSPAGWRGTHHGSSGYILSQQIEVARQQYELLLGDESLAAYPEEGDWHLRVMKMTDDANPELVAEVSHEEFLNLQPSSAPVCQ